MRTLTQLPGTQAAGRRGAWRVALLLVALATGPALAGDLALDHDGTGRCFDISRQGSGAADVLSRGDGGCLAADMIGPGRTGILMLGDDVRGHVVDRGGDGTVYLGMCPPGMTLEPVVRAPGETDLRIPRCI